MAQPKQIIRENTKKEAEKLGLAWDEKVFNNAYNKLKLWCNHAYVDGIKYLLIEYEGEEEGLDCIIYYVECLGEVKDTFNRQSHNHGRRKS